MRAASSSSAFCRLNVAPIRRKHSGTQRLPSTKIMPAMVFTSSSFCVLPVIQRQAVLNGPVRPRRNCHALT